MAVCAGDEYDEKCGGVVPELVIGSKKYKNESDTRHAVYNTLLCYYFFRGKDKTICYGTEHR